MNINEKIDTVGKLRQAIKDASDIYIQVRFGVSENWFRITKMEARFLVASYNDNVTAKAFEIPSGVFGEFKGSNLFLG